MPNPVTKAAERVNQNGNVVSLSTGVRVRVRPVSARLLDEVQRTVPHPAVPKQFLEDKGIEVENPMHPAYLREVEEANSLRGQRVTEALMLFGFELVDGVPPEESWLPKLRYLESRGMLDLSGYDLEIDLDRELLFKGMVAVGAPDLMLLSMASGLTEAEVAAAEDSFQRQKARPADKQNGGTPPA